MRTTGIYKITNPKGKIYIGQSVDIKERFYQYKITNAPKQPRLKNSLLKYGYEAHLFEIIEQCSTKDLNERERYWQEYYNVIGNNGLNCSLVQTQEKKYEHSEHTKRKMSKLKNGVCGIPLELRIRKGSDNGKSKMVLNIDTKEIFETVSECAIKNKINRGTLQDYLLGKIANKSPFVFCDKKGKPLNKNYKEEKRKKGVSGGAHYLSKTIINTKTGKLFYSIKEAAEYLGLKTSTLQAQLRGQNKNKTPLQYA